MTCFPASLRKLLIGLVLVPVLASAQLPAPPEIAARNYLLMDLTSGQVLASRDVDAQIEPASLTKFMTSYLVFEALRAKKITLEQRLPVSELAWKMPGSRMFIDPRCRFPWRICSRA